MRPTIRCEHLKISFICFVASVQAARTASSASECCLFHFHQIVSTNALFPFSLLVNRRVSDSDHFIFICWRNMILKFFFLFSKFHFFFRVLFSPNEASTMRAVWVSFRVNYELHSPIGIVSFWRRSFWGNAGEIHCQQHSCPETDLWRDFSCRNDSSEIDYVVMRSLSISVEKPRKPHQIS